MSRMFTSRVARVLGLLLAIIATTIAVLPLSASAQATSPQTAGTSSVTFSDAWQYSVEASDAESVFLSSTNLRGTVFIYAEVTDPTTDSNLAISQFTEGFFGSFGDGDQAIVNSGVVPTDQVWELYSVSSDTVPYGTFVSAHAGSTPGVVTITVLAGPAGSFDLAVESVQQDIAINGAGTTLSTLDAAALSASLSGDAPVQPTTTTPGGETTDGDSGRGGLTLPPLGGTTPTEPATTTTTTTTTTTEPAGGTAVQLTDSVTVNSAVVAYGGDWLYNDSASSQDQIAFFSHATSASSLFGYATTPDTTGDVMLSLTQFNEGFFSSYDGTNVVEVTTEALPSGHAYSLYTLDRTGVPYVVVTVADTTSVQGEFRVQVLLTERAEFDAIFPTVQQSFQIDGVGAMSELDLAQMDTLLGGGQQSQTTTTTTTTTGQPANGPLAELQAADVQGSCDGIGWAIVAPDQIPASEADINYRSACAGGGTFVAICGTSTGNVGVAPEAGTIWIRCDVTVRADASPLAITPLDFTMTDGGGTAHTLEFQALFGMTGVQYFPDDAIPAGQTVRGTVAFAVPEAMTGPMVLSVNPDAFQASGVQPVQLGIDGSLQPFETLGQ